MGSFVCLFLDHLLIWALELVSPCRGPHPQYLQLLLICSVGARLVALEALGQAICAARLIA